MKQNFLKLAAKSWQEIIFIIAIGVLLFEISTSLFAQHTIDKWDITLMAFIFPVFICMIGQLFWKRRILSLALSVLLALGSFVIIMMAFYYIATTNTNIVQAISMLAVGITLLTSAVAMHSKHRKSKENNL